MIKRSIYYKLKQRLIEPRRFIQILAGPRQVGKTTLIQELQKEIPFPSHYAAAETPFLQDQPWIEQQWNLTRAKLKSSSGEEGVLLVLDEVQKVAGWAETVKKFWDEDTRDNHLVKVVLLGSAQLLIQKGLTESLAGRFELIHAPHWSYAEMKEAFHFDLPQYLYFGGYPGAASLIGEQERWSQYILDSLIETTVSKDILQMVRVDKPVLLKKLFQLGCQYSGQVLSYTKILGQLHEAGNTTTLAHYLDLLSSARLLTGLSKFASQGVRQRASSPKLQVLNTAFMTAPSSVSFSVATNHPEFWGRLVESSVGAHLVNSSYGKNIEIFYWREKSQEVDFILKWGNKILPIEVKSGRQKGTLPGIKAFNKTFKVSNSLLVGDPGIPLEEFLLSPVEHWIKEA